jgi:hypothetical protein
LVRSVGVVLEEAPASSCDAADADGDARVDIAEVLAAVANSLGGCAL